MLILTSDGKSTCLFRRLDTGRFPSKLPERHAGDHGIVRRSID
jgi:hypothetical protein